MKHAPYVIKCLPTNLQERGMNKVHMVEVLYNAWFVQELFSQQKQTQKHTDVYHAHQISSFSCSLCKKILSTEEILKRHLVTVHGENNFECHKCGKKYSRNNHYIRHLRDVHSIESKTNLNYAAIEFIYKFNCDLCEQRFKRQETLQRHIKSKHGEQSEEYQCNVCSKKFNRNDNRKRHESGCSM